jgi:hypothetical protein
MSRFVTAAFAAFAALVAAGCASDDGGSADTAAKPPAKPEAKKPAAPPKNPWDGTGMTVWEDTSGGHWVFLDGDKELANFLAGKEPAKRVTRVGAAPGGKNLLATDAAALDAFATWKPGFAVRSQKEKDKTYVWVFKEGAKELAEFDKAGTLAKHTTRLGAGPGGATLKAPDAATLDAYAAKKYPEKK